MKYLDIAKMYNQEGLTLREIGEKLKISRSTVQRRLINNGFNFNKKTSKYEYDEKKDKSPNTTDNIENDDIIHYDETGNKKVYRTYWIDEKIDRAIKIKAAIENKKPIDVVREALENYIDKKYLDM